MNEDKLKEIIKRKEGERLEFKSSGADPRRLAEIVASFANTSGGLLLIGVNDAAGVRGTRIGRGTIENYPLEIEPPVWKDIGVAVITTLYDPTYKKKVDISKIDFSVLNERQKRALGYIEEHGRISKKEYVELFGISDMTAKRDLADLVEAN